MQRVLLFTDDINLGLNLAQSTGEHERIAQVSFKELYHTVTKT